MAHPAITFGTLKLSITKHSAVTMMSRKGDNHNSQMKVEDPLEKNSFSMYNTIKIYHLSSVHSIATLM